MLIAPKMEEILLALLLQERPQKNRGLNGLDFLVAVKITIILTEKLDWKVELQCIFTSKNVDNETWIVQFCGKDKIFCHSLICEKTRPLGRVFRNIDEKCHSTLENYT